jgi:hypothetical protein
MLDLSCCMRRGEEMQYTEIRTTCVFECVGRNQNIDVSSLMVYERRVNRVYWKVVDWMDNSPLSPEYQYQNVSDRVQHWTLYRTGLHPATV